MTETKNIINNKPTSVSPYPILYRGNKISLEKARVLIRLKRGVVFPRTIPYPEEVSKTQAIVDTLTEEEQDTFYYKRVHDKLYAVSYFNGLESFVSELTVEQTYNGGYKVYRTHEDGYREYRTSFNTKAELDRYLNSR